MNDLRYIKKSYIHIEHIYNCDEFFCGNSIRILGFTVLALPKSAYSKEE